MTSGRNKCYTSKTRLTLKVHNVIALIKSEDQFNLSLIAREPVFGGVRPSKTQTSLLSNRDHLKA